MFCFFRGLLPKYFPKCGSSLDSEKEGVAFQRLGLRFLFGGMGLWSFGIEQEGGKDLWRD